MSQFQLSERLIELSEASTWDEAKLEWGLEHIWRENKPDTCLCGHSPILEICLIRNIKNNNSAILGNSCVKKFGTLPSDLIFDAVRRIQEKIESAINPETINHAHIKGWMDDWERTFYMDTWRKRNPTGRQRNTRIKINQKVLLNVVGARNKVNE